MSEKIIDELLKDAPPGQVKEVLKDVKTLVGDDAKVDNVARKTIREYDLKHLTHATYKHGGKSHSLLLSKHAETKLSSDLYYDPATGLCVRYDHLEQRAEALEGEEAKSEEAERMRGDEAAESRRKAVETQLRDVYMEKNYPFGACAVYVTGGGDLAVCISSTVSKPRSYWSGRWTSEWVLSTKGDGPDSFSLKGKCDVATHYYEQGNVQFRSNREFSVADRKTSDLAKDCIKCIAEEEFKYQEDLQESLREFAETTFKKLRRQLPLTQLKVPWHTGAASLATELMKREKA